MSSGPAHITAECGGALSCALCHDSDRPCASRPREKILASGCDVDDTRASHARCWPHLVCPTFRSPGSRHDRRTPHRHSSRRLTTRASRAGPARGRALGLPSVLFCIVTGAAPLAAMLFNVPVATLGGGYASPAAFIVATVALTIFSVGYIAMCRRVTSAGGFYTFVTRGLGRVVGLGIGPAHRDLLHGLRRRGDRDDGLLRVDHGREPHRRGHPGLGLHDRRARADEPASPSSTSS